MSGKRDAKAIFYWDQAGTLLWTRDERTGADRWSDLGRVTLLELEQFSEKVGVPLVVRARQLLEGQGR